MIDNFKDMELEVMIFAIFDPTPTFPQLRP